MPALVCAEGLLAVNNPATNGTERGVYASMQAFEGNDQVAMRQYGGDWQGDYSPRSGTNLGLLAARAEAGVQWNGYRLGGLYRGEALVEASRDTSDLVRGEKTRTGYESGRPYGVDYRIKGFEADGVRLSKSFQMAWGADWQLDWGGGASYLRGKRIKLESITGQVTSITTPASVSFGASLDDIDSNKPNVVAQNAPLGEGYSLDAGLVLRRRDGLRLEAAVNDLAGRMNWRNLPRNVMTANSATAFYDASGYINYRAALNGQYSSTELTQALDPKVWLAVAYPLDNFEVQGAASFTRGYWFPQAGVAYHLNPAWQVKADYDFHFKTVGLDLRHRWFSVGLRADSADVSSAKAYGLNAGVNIPF